MSVLYTEARAPASAAEIRAACDELGLAQHAWLTGFWALCNGAMLNDRVQIYATDFIAERNQTYDIATSFPEHVSVGDDSGGRLILMPKSGETRFHMIDAGDPFIEDAEIFASIEALVAYIDSEE
jgi:penicillin V acylase-like amidase (Ntn superfamily)